jgi:apolipoprotein N-acyltransferase
MKIDKRTLFGILMSAASGVLSYLSFPPAGASYLALVSLIPLFFAVKNTGKKGSFLYGYLAGLVFFGFLLSWLGNVSWPGAIVLVLVMSVYFGAFAFLANIVIAGAGELLLLPFIWVVVEYLRSNLLTGFPWGQLAYSQYRNITLIQIADLFGSYGVSFLIVLVNTAVFAFLIKSPRKKILLMLALVAVVAAAGYGFYRTGSIPVRGSARISVIQGNIPQESKWDETKAFDNIKTYGDLTLAAAETEPDMIIWPETAYPYIATAKDLPSEISALAQKTGVPVLAGVIYMKDDKYFNSSMLFNENGVFPAMYFKIHLVPFGEYIPLEKIFSLVTKYIDKPIGDYTPGKEYELFPLRSTYMLESKPGEISRETHFYRVGTLICFEDVFPGLSREYVRKGADILVNITNDAWFGRTAAAEQHLQSSVFRAVENRVPVVRAANTGVSCFVSYTGEILSRVNKGGGSIFVEGYRTENINTARARSLYTVWGDYFVMICAFLLAAFCLSELKIARKLGKR